MSKQPVKIVILGVGITNESNDNILEYVVGVAEKGTKKSFIATPNPEMIVAAHKDKALRIMLNSADLALCDGVGLRLAGQLVANGSPPRITGVDFMKSLCENVSKKPITVGFLGGRANVAEKTAECLLSEYPGLKVVFVSEEWNQEGFIKAKRLKIKDLGLKNKKEESIKHESSFINLPHIDILFVAFGFPKQERWIVKNLDDFPVTVAMGVGGAFDYLSGEVGRAPFFIRSLGFEWLYRLLRQPWRFKRQLALIEFLGLVIKEKIRLMSR